MAKFGFSSETESEIHTIANEILCIVELLDTFYDGDKEPELICGSATLLRGIHSRLRGIINDGVVINDDDENTGAAQYEDVAAKSKTARRDQYVVIPTVRPEDFLKNTTA